MQSENQQIKDKGLKVTPARIAVLKTLKETKKPLDIKELLNILKNSNIKADQATIYRIVENFYKTGLVQRLQLQENKFYYESSIDDHHHAICTTCGKITDISGCSIKTIEDEIEQKYGFKTNNHQLEFFGCCRDCSTA